MKPFYNISIIVLVILLTGCSKPDLSGSWKGTFGAPVKATSMLQNLNGSLELVIAHHEQTISGNGNIQLNGRQLALEISGIYLPDGHKIDIKMGNLRLQGEFKNGSIVGFIDFATSQQRNDEMMSGRTRSYSPEEVQTAITLTKQ